MWARAIGEVWKSNGVKQSMGRLCLGELGGVPIAG